MSDPIKPHSCLVGPFQTYKVIVEGRSIPGLTAWPESETQTMLTLDGRLGIVIGNRDLQSVAWLVANALAIGQGYSHLGAQQRGFPFAPLCSQIELPPLGRGLLTMTNQHSTTGEQEEIARLLCRQHYEDQGLSSSKVDKLVEDEWVKWRHMADEVIVILSRSSRMAASPEGEVAEDELVALEKDAREELEAHDEWLIEHDEEPDHGPDEVGVHPKMLLRLVAVVRSAMLAARPDAGREVEPVKMLVDQEWISRHVATDPDVSVEAVGAINPLSWLSANQNCELSFDYGSADEDGKGWCVHRVNGGVNDREWSLIGSGETPEAAIVAAIGGGQ